MLEKGSCLQSLGEMNTSGKGQENLTYPSSLPSLSQGVRRHKVTKKLLKYLLFLACKSSVAEHEMKAFQSPCQITPYYVY